MAYVGVTPWHSLGRQVPPHVTAEDMITAAGLNWNVEKVPAPGARMIDEERKLYERYLVMRERLDDEEGPVALGMVRSGFVPLQNEDAFGFFEPFVQNGWASFHTAGMLGHGETVWVLAKLAEQIVIGDDDAIDRFLLLSNRHDGSGAVTIRFTPIRVVCQNTLNLAMDGGKSVLKVRHSKNIAENIAKAEAEQMRRIIDRVFANAATLFGQMAARTLSARDTDEFLAVIFPKTTKQRENGKEPERWTRIKDILADPKITPSKARHTLWDLYNAIVYDEDFRGARETEDSRLERVWFGDGHDLKVNALKAARSFLSTAA
jgi:phage/plasmid-like protein (TIGR03299 family)